MNATHEGCGNGAISCMNSGNRASDKVDVDRSVAHHLIGDADIRITAISRVARASRVHSALSPAIDASARTRTTSAVGRRSAHRVTIARTSRPASAVLFWEQINPRHHHAIGHAHPRQSPGKAPDNRGRGR
jgi:hypothetical protein